MTDTQSNIPEFDVTEHLRDNEIVLWHGQPNVRAYIRARFITEAASVIFLVAFAGVAVIDMLHAFTWQLWIEVSGVGTVVFLPVVERGIIRGATATMYFVTSQRVMIFARELGGIKRNERELSETLGMKLIPGPQETATIQIEKRRRFLWHGMGGTVVTTEFSLKSVDNADEVFKLIQKAREQRSMAVQSRVVRKPPR